MSLPPCGSVLGVDVGWSRERRSSAACRLDWDEQGIGWTIGRFTAEPGDRQAGLRAVMGTAHLLVAAFDGPLRGDLQAIHNYREAERQLSMRWVREAIGKIGQSNSGSGRLLNAATNDCANVVLKQNTLAEARHDHAIHKYALVEAFPNSFLGLMLEDPASLKGGRGQRSDRYYVALAEAGTLTALMQAMLPGRTVKQTFGSVTNHDDRAALVCALTALCVAAGRYTAVGNADGWIFMPPIDLVASWTKPAVAGWNQPTNS